MRFAGSSNVRAGVAIPSFHSEVRISSAVQMRRMVQVAMGDACGGDAGGVAGVACVEGELVDGVDDGLRMTRIPEPAGTLSCRFESAQKGQVEGRGMCILWRGRCG